MLGSRPLRYAAARCLRVVVAATRRDLVLTLAVGVCSLLHAPQPYGVHQLGAHHPRAPSRTLGLRKHRVAFSEGGAVSGGPRRAAARSRCGRTHLGGGRTRTRPGSVRGRPVAHLERRACTRSGAPGRRPRGYPPNHGGCRCGVSLPPCFRGLFAAASPRAGLTVPSGKPFDANLQRARATISATKSVAAK